MVVIPTIFSFFVICLTTLHLALPSFLGMKTHLRQHSSVWSLVNIVICVASSCLLCFFSISFGTSFQCQSRDISLCLCNRSIVWTVDLTCFLPLWLSCFDFVDSFHKQHSTQYNCFQFVFFFFILVFLLLTPVCQFSSGFCISVGFLLDF